MLSINITLNNIISKAIADSAKITFLRKGLKKA
jgi:hypothetical protein